VFNPTRKQLQLIKAAVFVAALLPFARLILYIIIDRLGANPVEFITRSTGDWTLYFLIFTLAITPLRHLTNWVWLTRLRRMLGLYAFFYVCLHFLTFLWFDHFFDLKEMWKDVVKRPFITIGFIAFVLLVPLAVTSTNAMVKRLGYKRWQLLHRLVYLIACLGVLHFFWMRAGKNNFGDPILYGSIVAALLLMRVWWAIVQRRKAAVVTPRVP
jgi:sulfoxide reductase heme-binding subunit YedZ